MDAIEETRKAVEDLKSDDAGVRTRAAETLRKAAEAGVDISELLPAVPLLIAFLKDDALRPDPKAVAAALVRIAPTEAVPSLAVALRADSDIPVRVLAAQALGRINGIDADSMAIITDAISQVRPDRLERLIDGTTSREVRELARHALVGVQKDAQARYDAHDAFLRGLEGQSTRTANPLAGDGKLSEGLPKAPAREPGKGPSGRKITS